MPNSPCGNKLDVDGNVELQQCDGITTGWWTKVPPSNEVSHFENL
jgi:hypothetical protein